MRALTSACCIALWGCGRTGLPPVDSVIVQVVGHDDDPVPFATVELSLAEDGPVLEQIKANDHGVAVFGFRGKGTYRFRASDRRCCWVDGATVAIIEAPRELVVVETAISTCPTWLPTSCN